SRTFQGNQAVRSQSFDRLPIQLNQKPEDFRRAIRIDSDALSLRELAAYVERLRQDGYNPARYATDLFGRTAFPFVCLIMALIGLTMSLMETGSRGTGLVRGVGYSLLVGVLYWSNHSVPRALGRSNVVPQIIQADPGLGRDPHDVHRQHKPPAWMKRPSGRQVPLHPLVLLGGFQQFLLSREIFRTGSQQVSLVPGMPPSPDGAAQEQDRAPQQCLRGQLILDPHQHDIPVAGQQRDHP